MHNLPEKMGIELILLCCHLSKCDCINSVFPGRTSTSQNLISITQCNFPLQNLTFKSVVKPKPKCESGIGFQFHTPGTEENIWSRIFFL